MPFEDFFAGLDKLFSKNDIYSAEDYIAQHLDIARKNEDTHYQLAVLNEQIGYYRSLSRFSEALMAGKQAMQLIAAPAFAGSIAAATTMLNLATALRAGGRTEEALELYRKTCEIYTSTLETSDPRWAALYNNMAQALMANHNSKAALDYLHKAINILKRTQENRAELATTHSNIALLYISFDNKKAAAVHLQAAISVFDKLDYDDVHYPAALAAMAQLMYLNKNYSGAVAHYRLALKKTEDIFGQNADYARICRNCARICALTGMSVEAEKLTNTAQAVESKLNSANSALKGDSYARL